MAFKENLKIELEYQDIKVKELAARSGISRRTIDQYLSSAAKMPSAENAVKIAAALGVSVEYLVTGLENKKNVAESQNDKAQEAEQLRLYRKYHELILDCEKLSQKEQDAVRALARNLS